MALSVRGETGGRFDGARSADGEKYSAAIECGKNALQVVGNFAEPADVRTNFSAAGTTRKFRSRFVEGSVFERWARARLTAALEEFAVHVVDALGAGFFVKVIDILRAEEKTIGEGALESGKGEMSGIWFCGCCGLAAHGIEMPDEMGIAVPGFGCGNIFDAVVVPETARIAKGGEAAFSADAGAGENEEVISGRAGKVLHGCRVRLLGRAVA